MTSTPLVQTTCPPSWEQRGDSLLGLEKWQCNLCLPAALKNTGLNKLAPEEMFSRSPLAPGMHLPSPSLVRGQAGEAAARLGAIIPSFSHRLINFHGVMYQSSTFLLLAGPASFLSRCCFLEPTPSSPRQPLLELARSVISSEVGGELALPGEQSLHSGVWDPGQPLPTHGLSRRSQPCRSCRFSGRRRHRTAGGLAQEGRGTPRSTSLGDEPPALLWSFPG